MYSIPVRITNVESLSLKPDSRTSGDVGLNKTNAKAFSKVLTRDTEKWIGATYTALVNLGRNPQTNSQVKTFLVIESSIKSKPSEMKDKSKKL